MPPELAIAKRTAPVSMWRTASLRLVAAAVALFVVTLAEWREMAHQWWDIDTYAHILLIPPILAWLVWLRRGELAQVVPSGWTPGVGVVFAGLAAWLAGREIGINLVSQAGAIVALQGTVAALLGLRATIVLAFPLLFAFFLVPFGDEIIPALQDNGAKIRAYDPEGMAQAKTVLENVEFAQSAYAAIEGADALVLVTEWDAFRALDLAKVRTLLKSPIVVDLRNVYRPDEMERHGFAYVSIGR